MEGFRGGKREGREGKEGVMERKEGSKEGRRE